MPLQLSSDHPGRDRHGFERDRAVVALPERGEIVVYDTEFTAWQGSAARDWSEPWESREIIQIGAVRLDVGRGYREIDAFEILVKPVTNPVLSAYVTALTGIDNGAIERSGVWFSEAAERFTAFSARAVLIGSNGWDGAVMRESAARTAAAGRGAARLPLERMVDLRPFLAASLGIDANAAISCELPAMLGLPGPERGHTGLADARAIAAVLRALAARGAALAAARRLTGSA